MNEKELEKKEKIQKLYSLAMSSAQGLQPKHVLFGWKCPKCGGKLSKELLKELIFAGPSEGEFPNKVVSEAGLPQGVWEMEIEHFTCKCGYEFATRALVNPAGEIG